MGQFNAVWDQTRTLLLPPGFDLPVTPLSLPAEYAEIHQADKELHLRFEVLRLGQTGELRSVRIHAPKIAIINLFFFPQPGWDLPIYALEFVALGRRPVIGVMDLLSLSQTYQSQTAALMQQAHQLFPLPNADDPPDWYTACRSGQDFFVRPCTEAEFDVLGQAHLFVWKTLLSWIAQATPSEIEAPQLAAVLAYKTHHREHTPGLRLLESSFGKEWTREFLAGYLFA